MRNVSKKVIGGYVCLVMLMVVLFGTLNGNVSQAESSNGKQWAEPGGYLESLNGVKYVLFGKDAEFSSLESSWLGVLDSEEPLISCKWTYMEGTKQSKEFIEFKSYDELELGNVISLRRRNITEQGKAIYHIVAESEHYYTEFDTTLIFIPSSRVVVTLPGSVINIPIGTYDYLDMDFISEYSYSTFLTMENEPNEVNEEYELSDQCLTIRKPGDYQLLMELRADYGDGLYLTVPVTVHSDNSISEISFSGDPVAVTVEGVNTIENGDYEPGLVILSDSEETDSSTDSTFSDASASLDDDDSPSDSTFSDAFASLDDLDDESDGNTDSLDDFDSPVNTPEPENNLEELTKEDAAVLIADEIVNSMNSSEFVPVQKEVFLERNTELQRNGMFVWPIPEGFSLMKSNEESVMAGKSPCDIK